MLPKRKNVREYLESKKGQLLDKVERTPMEKFSIFFLILITVTALVLGVMQFKNNIESPLHPSYIAEKRTEIRKNYNISDLEQANKEQSDTALQQQDSDLDGLDDYSEINIYGTSPYLEDTDSDGLWDKEEILAGTDPNCPRGTQCEATDSDQAVSSGAVISEIEQSDLDADQLLDLQNQLLSGDLDLSALGIENQDLQAVFDQLGEAQNFEDSAGQDQALTDFKNMTGEQIRQEMINRGFDQTVLDGISDEELESLLSEVISSY